MASRVATAPAFSTFQQGGTCTPATMMAAPSVVGGVLASATSSACAEPGRFTDAYTFTATAGQRVSILVASGFDAFIRLQGPSGFQEVTDDNSGGGTNARIPSNGFLTLDQEGTYTVFVSSAPGGREFQSGPYALVVASPDRRSTFVNALAIDPTTPAKLFAGTIGNGVSQTTDGTATWTSANNGLPATASISAVAIDPQTPANVFAGTIGGTGFFRSTDGGATWTEANRGLSATARGGIFSLGVNPVFPNIIFAGTPAGLFVTLNSGDDWFRVGTGLENAALISSITVDPGNFSNVYASTFGTGIFKSTSNGATWRAANTGLPDNATVTNVAIDPLNTSTLYATLVGAGVYKSTDGGDTWSASNGGTLDTANVTSFAIDPQTTNNLYAGTVGGGVFKSTDGGATWTASNSGLPENANVFDLLLNPTTPTTLYAAVFGGGVFQSTDSGATWTEANSGLPTSVIPQDEIPVQRTVRTRTIEVVK